MRINKFVAAATGLSRRVADQAVAEGRVAVNQAPAQPGQDVGPSDRVTLNGRELHAPETNQTIMLNKPVGYVVSRDGQGSPTIYELLPAALQHLKPVGRLDKDSSGLLLLTTDGALANQLTHPRYGKEKVYEVTLGRPLADADRQQLAAGVMLEDGPSRLAITPHDGGYTVRLREGRNRQIRRSFGASGYTVVKLHRTQFGPYRLNGLATGQVQPVD